MISTGAEKLPAAEAWAKRRVIKIMSLAQLKQAEIMLGGSPEQVRETWDRGWVHIGAAALVAESAGTAASADVQWFAAIKEIYGDGARIRSIPEREADGNYTLLVSFLVDRADKTGDRVNHSYSFGAITVDEVENCRRIIYKLEPPPATTRRARPAARARARK